MRASEWEKKWGRRERKIYIFSSILFNKINKFCSLSSRSLFFILLKNKTKIYYLPCAFFFLFLGAMSCPLVFLLTLGISALLPSSMLRFRLFFAFFCGCCCCCSWSIFSSFILFALLIHTTLFFYLDRLSMYFFNQEDHITHNSNNYDRSLSIILEKSRHYLYGVCIFVYLYWRLKRPMFNL